MSLAACFWDNCWPEYLHFSTPLSDFWDSGFVYNGITKTQRRLFMSSFDKIIGYESVKNEVARICDVVKTEKSIRSWGGVNFRTDCCCTESLDSAKR